MPGMNLYLTIEQYLSQSFPYFLEHLIERHYDRLRHGGTINQRLPFKVASTPVDEDGDKEYAVEVRNGSSGANDGAPEEAHNPVGDVVLVRSNVS